MVPQRKCEHSPINSKSMSMSVSSYGYEVRKNTINLQDHDQAQTNQVQVNSKQRLIQQQLLLLFHAYNCHKLESGAGFTGPNANPNPNPCKIIQCSTMRAVLHHMTTCRPGLGSGSGPQKSAKCPYPYCTSSKAIMQHWSTCSKHNCKQDCSICVPFKESSSSGSSKMGFPVDLVQDKASMDPEFLCSLCKNVLVDPAMVHCCQQLFCGSCIGLWVQVSSRCPMSRCSRGSGSDNEDREIKLVKPQQCFVNVLNRLQVKCANGCGTSGIKLGDLGVHQETCERRMLNGRKRHFTEAGLEGQPDSKRAFKKHEIWSGPLEWQEKLKNDGGTGENFRKITFSSKAYCEPELAKLGNWPEKLILKLIPTSMLEKLGPKYSCKSPEAMKIVQFKFDETCADAELGLLKRALKSGYSGYVHFSSTADQKMAHNTAMKVLILRYDSSRDAFVGFIPNDQQGFVFNLRQIVASKKITATTAGVGIKVQESGLSQQLTITSPQSY